MTKIGDFRGFVRLKGASGERLMHPNVQKRIETIRQNCNFPSPAAFDAFWIAMGDHLGLEWPEYEDTRRLNLFRRALDGEKITRAELIGPHLELSGKLPPGGWA